MLFCTDPSLTFLNGLGYSVVRQPRKELRPLTILASDNGQRSALGTIDQVWTSTEPVPVTGPPQTSANISGQRTDDLDVKFGLGILSTAVGALAGMGAPDLSTSFKRARKVRFQFQNVVTMGIDPFLVGKYLASGTLATTNPFVKRFFDSNEKRDVQIITSVLQSNSITVSARGDRSGGAAVDAPAIEAMLKAKLSVQVGSTDESEITFTGPEFLTFGFQSWAIRQGAGGWEIAGVKPSAATAFSAGGDGDEEDALETPLIPEDGLIEIDLQLPA